MPPPDTVRWEFDQRWAILPAEMHSVCQVANTNTREHLAARIKVSQRSSDRYERVRDLEPHWLRTVTLGRLRSFQYLYSWQALFRLALQHSFKPRICTGVDMRFRHPVAPSATKGEQQRPQQPDITQVQEPNPSHTTCSPAETPKIPQPLSRWHPLAPVPSCALPPIQGPAETKAHPAPSGVITPEGHDRAHPLPLFSNVFSDLFRVSGSALSGYFG